MCFMSIQRIIYVNRYDQAERYAISRAIMRKRNFYGCVRSTFVNNAT